MKDEAGGRMVVVVIFSEQMSHVSHTSPGGCIDVSLSDLIF